MKLFLVKDFHVSTVDFSFVESSSSAS